MIILILGENSTFPMIGMMSYQIFGKTLLASRGGDIFLIINNLD